MTTPLLEATATVATERPRPLARRAALLGLGLLAAFALIGPLVLADPAAQDLSRFLEPPSASEPLGRDDYGRSVLARLAHATRLSLATARWVKGDEDAGEEGAEETQWHRVDGAEQ